MNYFSCKMHVVYEHQNRKTIRLKRKFRKNIITSPCREWNIWQRKTYCTATWQHAMCSWPQTSRLASVTSAWLRFWNRTRTTTAGRILRRPSPSTGRRGVGMGVKGTPLLSGRVTYTHFFKVIAEKLPCYKGLRDSKHIMLFLYMSLYVSNFFKTFNLSVDLGKASHVTWPDHR